ncbi:hypothetical protein [Bacillus sp. 165]|uniref:hypothetical protein n=1 Tax=Bacillus sp. 165 TaxID=1529117 RepID=UPI001ADD15EF|nr:hypothetical protein [Bacillus sp. 165]MBO9130425.1 hypothetical protein [Bacillus sp. 165]
MNIKVIHKTLLMLVILFCMLNPSTYAASLEDMDLPISFRVEMLPWQQVDKIIPNKSIFTIIDIDTGLQFKVQRRAGNKHADVQPLTRSDTKIMKKIYGGKWSWKRRAILILVDDQLLAASMHGMPHGAGALPNGFPGHFCIHFYGSTTHRTHHTDLWHKVMMLKASSKIDKYINNASPHELIEIFAISISSRDRDLLDLTLSNNKEGLEALHHSMKNIDYFVIKTMSLLPKNDIINSVSVKISVQADMYTENQQRTKKLMDFIIQRNSVTAPWKIDSVSLSKQLK